MADGKILEVVWASSWFKFAILMTNCCWKIKALMTNCSGTVARVSGNSEVLDTLSITRWTPGVLKVGQLAISKLHSEKSGTSSCERPRKRQSVDKRLDLDNFQTEYKNWLKSPKNFSVNKSCTFSIRAEQAPEGQEGTKTAGRLMCLKWLISRDLQDQMFAKDSGLLLPELSRAGAQEKQNLSPVCCHR